MKPHRFRAGKRLWSATEEELLRERYSDQRTSGLARELQRSIPAVFHRARALGLSKSAAYLASPDACRLRRGDKVGASTRFRKGQTPHNKGLRRPGWSAGRMKETQFKKGERSGVAVRLYKPIGSERLSKDGYIERKVNDGLPLRARWRAVHLIVWEAARGPVPEGHVIGFVNGDKRDIRLENLCCLPRRELMARNSVHNLPEPLALTIQLLGALNRQIRKGII